MIKKILVLCLITCLNSSFSKPNDPYELALFGSIPSAIVGGSVNAITGDYIINQEDYVIPAHEPITIQRSYSSQNGKGLFAGWQYGFNHLIAWWDAHDGVLVPEKSGVALTYYIDRPTATFKLQDIPGGLSNCFSGQIGARFDPTNNIVQLANGHYDNVQAILVKGPDGSQRLYRYRKNWDSQEHDRIVNRGYYNPLFLEWEILPNGNKIHYEWMKVNKLFQLMRVRSTNHRENVEYAHMVFQYDTPDKKHINGFKIQTSSCREVNYRINSHAKWKHDCQGIGEDYCPQYNNSSSRSWLLTQVYLPERPSEDYTQAWQCPRGGYYVGKKALPEERFTQLYLYADGFYKDFQVRIKPHKRHPFYGKVYRLTESYPSGQNTICRLNYQFGKYEEHGGSTSVYDADGNLTTFKYNQNFLLSEIERCFLQDGKQNPYSKETFSWSTPKSGQANRLMNKTVTDNQGQRIFSYAFHYDTKGNVKQEDFTGNLSGHSSKSSETYTIKRTYHANHLLHKEFYPNGKIIESLYLDNTDLLTTRYIYHKDSQHLQQRQFFFYNDTVLVKEIQDDGTGRNCDDLTGVTQRIIKTIIPSQTKAKIGLPETITEEYLDIETGKTHILYKRKIQYTLHLQVASIEHFDSDGISRYTLTFKYDDKGRLIEKTDPYGNPHLSLYDGNDNLIYQNAFDQDFTLDHFYDLANRPHCSKQSSTNETTRHFKRTFNRLHQEIKTVDHRGNVTQKDYDAFGHLLKQTAPEVLLANGNVEPVITSFKYNVIGCPIESIDAKGNVTLTHYNSLGDPIQITHPDGAEEFYTYDLSGLLKTHLSPEKVLTSYEYDFLGRATSKKITSKDGKLLNEETYIYSAFNLIEKISFDGTRTIFEYDGAGRKTKEITDNRETQYEYDELGRQSRTTRIIDGQTAQITEAEYDLLDRVRLETELDQDRHIHSFTRYTYDSFNNPTATTKEVQLGDATYITAYDSFDRITRQINPLGHTTTIDYDDFYQNALGQSVLKKTTTDPNGTQTVEIFDAHDHLSLLEKYSPAGELLLREQFFYNGTGQQTQQISTLLPSEQTITKTWDYDSRGRIKTLRESPDTPYEKTTEYSYTFDGHLKQITKPSNLKITYTRDGLGRITTVKTSDDSCHYELSYDDMGYITQAKNCLTQKATIRSYDHFGNLLTETTEHGLTTQRTYDNLGRKLTLTLTDQSSIHYTYDAYHLTKVTRHSSSGQPLYTHTYDSYDKSHNLIAETYPHSLGTTTYQIDLLSRPIQKQNTFHIEDIQGFDPNGNLLAYTRESSLPTEQHQYSYDALDQITEEEGLFDHTYECDAHHNRQQKDDNPYETNSHHELLGTDTTENAYNWDGHLTTSNNNTYTYDGLDRLITLQTPQKTHHFQYDFFNRLLTHTVDNYPPENYLYDGQNELGNFPHELRILGQGKGAEIGASLAIETQNKLYIPLHDLFGNIIALIDPHKNQLVESYRYSAFGEEKLFNAYNRPVSTVLIPWRFHSKRKIDNLIFYGRRFYDPEHGRWLSPDPKGFDEGPNLYQFNRNNPFLYIDLYGEEIAEFWRHLAGPDHFSLDPMERIEHNKLELCAFTTGIGTKIGDFLDQARYEMYSFGSPTLFNLPEQTPISTLVADKIHEIFPHDREDPAFQMVARGTGYIVDLNLILFAPALSEVYASKRAMDTSEFCMQTFDLIDCPVYRSGFSFSEKSGRKFVEKISNKKIAELEEQISKWLGEKTKLIRNKAGDPVFISKDGTRRVRFDFINTHGDKMHMHIEQKIGNRWKDASSTHRIYPLD